MSKKKFLAQRSSNTHGKPTSLKKAKEDAERKSEVENTDYTVIEVVGEYKRVSKFVSFGDKNDC